MEPESIVEGAEKRPVYEIAFHLVPTLSADEVLTKFTSIKDLVSSKGGAFISEDMPKEFRLAYELSHTVENKKEWYTRSYFGWVKFECEESAIAEIENALRLDRTIIRYLMVRTVRDNTLYGKRFGTTIRRRPESKHETIEEKKPINTEELDKEIEAMIGEELGGTKEAAVETKKDEI